MIEFVVCLPIITVTALSIVLIAQLFPKRKRVLARIIPIDRRQKGHK